MEWGLLRELQGVDKANNQLSHKNIKSFLFEKIQLNKILSKDYIFSLLTACHVTSDNTEP